MHILQIPCSWWCNHAILCIWHFTSISNSNYLVNVLNYQMPRRSHQNELKCKYPNNVLWCPKHAVITQVMYVFVNIMPVTSYDAGIPKTTQVTSFDGQIMLLLQIPHRLWHLMGKTYRLDHLMVKTCCYCKYHAGYVIWCQNVLVL